MTIYDGGLGPSWEMVRREAKKAFFWGAAIGVGFGIVIGLWVGVLLLNI